MADSTRSRDQHRPIRLLTLALALLIGLRGLAGAAARESPFHFEIKEGQNLNYFLRDGPTAAHLLLRSGVTPRLLVAFPAGNSGIGLWFQSQQPPASQWVINSAPVARVARDSAGRLLHGISFEASIGAQRLEAKQAVLSSVRFLRDYQTSGAVPGEVLVSPEFSANALTWARNRLDGTISRLTPGAVNTEVVLDLTGGGSVAAIITNESARALELEEGRTAMAMFKASSVIVGVPA